MKYGCDIFMNKEEQSQNLYHLLLQRNTTNQSIIRKFSRKSNIFEAKTRGKVNTHEDESIKLPAIELRAEQKKAKTLETLEEIRFEKMKLSVGALIQDSSCDSKSEQEQMKIENIQRKHEQLSVNRYQQPIKCQKIKSAHKLPQAQARSNKTLLNLQEIVFNVENSKKSFQSSVQKIMFDNIKVYNENKQMKMSQVSRGKQIRHYLPHIRKYREIKMTNPSSFSKDADCQENDKNSFKIESAHAYHLNCS